mmetsp:Transcript_18535/g.57743  ORF Transcript_18535/g.57743 Transcript_18535/m.57743 type:complete len:214 (-) Transcript_18535:67-708(-)
MAAHGDAARRARRHGAAADPARAELNERHAGARAAAGRGCACVVPRCGAPRSAPCARLLDRRRSARERHTCRVVAPPRGPARQCGGQMAPSMDHGRTLLPQSSTGSVNVGPCAVCRAQGMVCALTHAEGKKETTRGRASPPRRGSRCAARARSWSRACRRARRSERAGAARLPSPPSSTATPTCRQRAASRLPSRAAGGQRSSRAGAVRSRRA